MVYIAPLGASFRVVVLESPFHKLGIMMDVVTLQSCSLEKMLFKYYSWDSVGVRNWWSTILYEKISRGRRVLT